MKKNFFIITAVVCGMSCTTTAYAQFKIGGKKNQCEQSCPSWYRCRQGYFHCPMLTLQR